MADLTANQIVGIVNSLGLSAQDVGAAFLSAKIGVQAKTVSTLLEAANQKDAVLGASESEELAPFQTALADKQSEIDTRRSQRVNTMAASRALLGEMAAGRVLTDQELKDLQTSLEF